ncbi:MAG: DUF2092 domain-containing protein [Candidatus Brocadiaceae bacterium]|nr:DUF2092 domain-containing protein [Candidatus Brocadiaceae bacterium]
MLIKQKPLFIPAVISAVLLLCMSTSCSIISAEETLPTETEEKPAIDSRTDKLLKAMGDYLKSSKQFSFHANITFDDLTPSGQKIQHASSGDIAVHRPNRVYAEKQSDLGGKRFWYDGGNMTLMDTKLGVYATEPVPADIDSAMDHLAEKYGFSPPLVDFVYSDPYHTLIENVESGFYAGLHDVEGVRCHHLAFVQKSIDWQIWIEDGKQMVPRKFVITYKAIPESPQFSAVLSEWDLDAELPDALFDIDLTSTEGFEKIEFMPVSDTVPNKSNPEDKK